MTMRILHVIHSVDPRSGGPSHALRALIRAQVEAGHDIAVVATTVQSAEPWSPRNDYRARMSGDPAFLGCELQLLPAFGRRRPWSRWAYTPGARRALCQRCDDSSRRPDVVHIHGTFSHLVTAAARVARERGIPYVVRPAGSLNALCLEQGAQRLKSAFIRLLLKKDLEHSAFVQSMSASEERELAGFVPPGRLHTVPHGVDPAPSQSESIFEQFPQLRGKRFILFLSRLHPKKRCGLLVEALARLAPAHPDLMLLIAGSEAGDGPAIAQLASSAGLTDRIVHSGFLEGAGKASAFQAAAVFALPSIDENFGVAVVEAMAHGTPVLVTPGVATHVYVDASGCGLTVEGTPESVTGGLEKLLSRDRNELGQCGRDYASKHLTWEAIVRRLDELYEASLARPAAGARPRVAV
jgi:glycosyltransferase involved in cell wall biosynthesis